MRATGTFAAHDLVSASWVHLRPRKSLAILGLLLLASGIVLSVFVLVTGDMRQGGWEAWAVPAFILYVTLVFGIGIPYKCRRSYRQRKDLQRPCMFTASEEGLQFSAEGITGMKKWSDYVKWKEGRHCFLLYMSDSLYQLLPKRFLQSETEVAAFREMLQRNVARRVA
jgi:hypothetical protein